MGSKYKHVFEPIRIRGVDFKNRLELAPPSPNLADREGRVTPEFVDFFRPFAKGGTAVIHVGNSVVDIREACDEERQLDLGSDACILPLTRFVEMCQGYGAHASLEINHNGKDVIVIEMAPDMSNLNNSAGHAVAMELTGLIRDLDIPVRLDCRLVEVTDNSVICLHMKTNERIEIPADTVLLAVGMTENHYVADSLRRCAPETEVFVVGDALEAGTVATAVMSGFKAAAYI